MFKRNWMPLSFIPVHPSYWNEMNNHRTKSGWCKLLLSALIPCILGIFTIIFTMQQQSLSERQRQQDQWRQLDAQRQTLFNVYIDDISKHLSETSDMNKTDSRFFLYIRTKTLTVLRTLDAVRKKYTLLFLYESRLIQDAGLNLYGADLNDVELIGPYNLDSLYLPGVFWSNAVFIDCHLIHAVFDQSFMINARFIRSTLESASLAETVLNNSDFTGATIIQTNFTGSSLIRANFLHAEVVQDINFTNADLLQASFTSHQLQGKRATTVPHNFSYARFPNGSFGPINAKNLIRNGDAESKDKQEFWLMTYRNKTLFTKDLRNISIKNMTIEANKFGQDTFAVLAKTRLYQIIDLRLYSLLIDTGNAVFFASAFMGCEVSGNYAYMEVTMHRPDKIIHGSRLYLSHTNEIVNASVLMHSYIRESRLNEHTRSVKIFFGVEMLPKPDVWCYFDNLTFTIRQNNSKY